MLSGFINLYKPVGLTSRDAVDRVKRLVHPSKIGHAGTLDPIACGVLVNAVGHATRLISYVQDQPKTYVAHFMLGQSSPTEDIEQEVTLHPGDPRPTPDDVAAILPEFCGPILQRPSAHSAVKVDGRRAYQLARAGRDFELAPRPIEIFALRILHYDYPQLLLHVECSGGTYIRALGRDIAERLGTSAVMHGLERTAIGHFTKANSVTPGDLARDGVTAHLLPMREAVADMPAATVRDVDLQSMSTGRSIQLDPSCDASPLAALSPGGELCAVLERQSDGLYRPIVNFTVKPAVAE